MSANIQMSDVSVDCVVFGFDDNQLKVLLIEQEKAPGSTINEKRYALPGDLVFLSEGLDAAARRVLNELTSLENVYLEQFHTFGDPDRVSELKDKEWLRSFRKNPDTRVITTGYYSLVKMEDYNPKAASFASDIVWWDVNEFPDLAFDHNNILTRGLSALRERFRHHPIGFELLPKKFTLSQLQELNEIVLGEKLDKRNFRRKISKMKSIIPLDEKQKGVLHKPAQLFEYDASKRV
jgi:8-oxo-dGTP diphosphatase